MYISHTTTRVSQFMSFLFVRKIRNKKMGVKNVEAKITMFQSSDR